MKAAVFLAIIPLFALAMSAASSHSSFPTVSELERQYGLFPGAQLPKQVASQVGIFDVKFVRASQGPNGHYLVELQLEPRR